MQDSSTLQVGLDVYKDSIATVEIARDGLIHQVGSIKVDQAAIAGPAWRCWSGSRPSRPARVCPA
jgi:hypothetical protein